MRPQRCGDSVRPHDCRGALHWWFGRDKSCSSPAASALLLNRRTLHRAERPEHAAVAQLRVQDHLLCSPFWPVSDRRALPRAARPTTVTVRPAAVYRARETRTFATLAPGHSRPTNSALNFSHRIFKLAELCLLHSRPQALRQSHFAAHRRPPATRDAGQAHADGHQARC